MVTSAAAQEVACSDPQTQTDMNICAAEAAARADDLLNAEWRVTQSFAKARGLGEVLLEAQRAWLGFRDAQCAAEAARYDGGSLQPLVHANCIERLTLRRTDDLRQFREP
ncbi:DUF1311 domain-containing protein [Salipiger sp. IMCC34102]|nr:DUF1311 domain-containing protein [Salipiger sp. IMCC34102]